MKRFELHRTTDVSGISGTGTVAEGVAFTDGTVVLRWKTEWPTSVVFHDRGIEAVQAVHGHGGATRIVWLDLDGPPPVDWSGMWTTLGGYVDGAIDDPKPNDAELIRGFMHELKTCEFEPVREWMRAMAGAPSTSECAQ